MFVLGAMEKHKSKRAARIDSSYQWFSSNNEQPVELLLRERILGMLFLTTNP